MKSPLLRAFFTPHVHPRLRKCLSRCTLDCGFKTPESPALRGFEAERGPIRGTSLYLVLKSNGFHHSENLPVKFVFSSKTVPANIAQKLPSQRCSQPFLIPLFNFLHKRPTFVFAGESGYTLGFQRKIAHKGLHGETGVLSSPGHSMALCYQRNSFYSTVLLYTYISRFSVTTHYQQREKIRQSYSYKFYPPTVPHCVFQLLPQTPHVCFHVRKRVHTRLSKKNRTQGHTRRNKGISDGVVLLPSERSARSRTSPGRVSERQTLPLLDLGRVYSRRTQRAFGTAMRLCVSLFRGVAAPLGCVIFFRFCRNCGLYTLFQIFFFDSPDAPACAVR